MAIMEISVVPVGTKTPSISQFVADCVRILDERGIPYELTAMGTEVEGEVEELLRLAAQMHQAPFARGAQRVLTTIKIDDRRDKASRIKGKKEAVLTRLKEMKGQR